MGKVMNAGKMGMKLLGTCSVQMMIGGIVAAVIPPQVSVVYKVAAYTGSCIAAMCMNDPVDRVVDQQFERLEANIEQTKRDIEILKQEIPSE